MGLTVCPAAVVAAPVEVVWENLVHWERYSEWFDRSLQVERIEPDGPATVGQTISFSGKAIGLHLHISSSRSTRSIPNGASSACMRTSHWACK